MSTAPTVWTYWEGPCPEYIQLCLETLQRWCNLRLLDRPGFEELWREDRDIDIDRLYVVHRADFIRIYLLHHYGGVWIDADCIVLNSIVPLAASLGTHDLVCYREPTGGVANNFLMANAATPVTRTYYEAVTAYLRAGRRIDWHEIGSIPLNDSVTQHADAVHWLDTPMIMPISWADSRRFLDEVPQDSLQQARQGAGRLHQPDAVCYMLSNHSMPESVKKMTREELLSRPTMLGYLYHVAFSGAGADRAPTAANYRYWQRPDTNWQAEYERRKTRHPYYHIQEMMITDHIAHHAPCRVLEWGCGTGRHLLNLDRVPRVEVHGYDQSQAMLGFGFQWASTAWRAERTRCGSPNRRLPYEDGAFDIVFTCEALLHTSPDDLLACLSEIIRICRGHILHMESPPTWRGYSASCEGCWGHDLQAAYASLGHSCELMTAGFAHQVPYLVKLREHSLRWNWNNAMLAIYQELDRSIEAEFARVGSQALAY